MKQKKEGSRTLTRLACAAVLSAASLSGTAAQECVQMPSGAVSWWPGDGTMDDVIGGYDAVNWNAVAFSPGQVGQAFDFVDPGAGMFVPPEPDLDFTASDEYSILLWMKTAPVNDPNADLTLVTKWDGIAYPYPYAIRMKASSATNPAEDAGTVWAQCTDSSSFPTVLTSKQFDDDVFHHVSTVFRHTDKTLEVHADGSKIAQRQYTADLGTIANGDSLWFGTRGGHFTGTFYDGVLDEIMIFDRAVSACEIEEIYSAGAAGVCNGDSDSDGVEDYIDVCPGAPDDQTDTDQDGAGDECDCAPLNPSHSIVPPGVCELTLGREGMVSKLEWTSVSEISGDGTRYDVLTGFLDELPVGTGASEQCLHCDLDALTADDAFVPDSSGGVWYLVRAVSQCGQGTWGFTSSEFERISPACP